MTLRRDIERIVTLTSIEAENLNELDTDGDGRSRLYAAALAAVAPTDEAELVELVWRDPDRAMAESAVVGHVDRRAAALDSTQALVRWAAMVTGVVGGASFPARRIQEWLLLRQLLDGNPGDPEELAAASNWLQRKIVAEITTPATLTTLGSVGRTKRLRNEAKSKAGRLPLPRPNRADQGEVATD